MTMMNKYDYYSITRIYYIHLCSLPIASCKIYKHIQGGKDVGDMKKRKMIPSTKVCDEDNGKILFRTNPNG